MFDLKALNAAVAQLEEERGIPRDKMLEAIELALATAYKKDFGKRGQIIHAHFEPNSGAVEFNQIKVVVDASMLKTEEEADANVEAEDAPIDTRVVFNEEQHIMIEDAQKIKKDVQAGDEITFPLEIKDDFGRIAAQTAKQVIIQKIREAEKTSVLSDYGKREGEILTGKVQRVERGNVFVDLGRTTAILARDEQIPGEFYKQGERLRAYLFAVEDTPRGINLRLSRSHPQFVVKLFEVEAPEIAEGTVVISAIAREPGSRTKIAVSSKEQNIDPVGSCVGQRGIRVSTVISELGGEKIDVIEYQTDPAKFIEEALSPAKIEKIELSPDTREAKVTVSADQFSLAIGKGGQNVRLAAKLTGWKIDIIPPTLEQ